MAYSKTPEKDTYSSIRMAAGQLLNKRPSGLSGSGFSISQQDPGMVNFLPIKQGNDIYAESRPRIVATQLTSFGTNAARGMYVWEKTIGTTYYFLVAGTKVLSSTDGVAFTHVDTLLTSATTPVRFTEFIDSTNVKKLILVDGVEGYVYTSNAAGTKITDADFPTPHIAFPIFMDGYLFLAKSGTGDIYNSNLNDPALWTAGDFISSEIYPDDLQALIKVDNYILAIGTQGAEYFLDAGNATGTPLARYEGGLLPFGCQFPNSIASNKNTLVMIANNGDGQSTFKLIEGLKTKDLNASFIVPMLNKALDNSYTATNNVRGYFFRNNGILYYGVLLNSVANLDSLNQNGSFVYSFDLDGWTEFRARRADELGTAPFPVAFSGICESDDLDTPVAGTHSGGYPFFGTLTQQAPTSISYQDNFFGTATYIPCEIRTPNLTFDTLNLKNMSRFGVIAEAASSGVENVTMNITWKDNDYAASSDTRSLEISSSTTNLGGFAWYPFLTQLGMFRRRSFNIAGTSSLRTALIIKYFEFDINKGQR